jgi:hypothetical protein
VTADTLQQTSSGGITAAASAAQTTSGATGSTVQAQGRPRQQQHVVVTCPCLHPHRRVPLASKPRHRRHAAWPENLDPREPGLVPSV